MPRKKKEVVLNRARLAILGTLNEPAILTAVTPYGYTLERMLALKADYETASTLTVTQASLSGKRAAATTEIKKARATANKAATNMFNIAHIVFRDDPSAIVAMGFNLPRKQSLAAWLHQTSLPYKAILANPAYIASMAGRGYDENRLRAELALVEEVGNVDVGQESAKGNQQRATKERDAMLAALDQAISDYKTVALVALASDPQQLEKLGFGAIP